MPVSPLSVVLGMSLLVMLVMGSMLALLQLQHRKPYLAAATGAALLAIPWFSLNLAADQAGRPEWAEWGAVFLATPGMFLIVACGHALVDLRFPRRWLWCWAGGAAWFGIASVVPGLEGSRAAGGPLVAVIAFAWTGIVVLRRLPFPSTTGRIFGITTILYALLVSSYPVIASNGGHLAIGFALACGIHLVLLLAVVAFHFERMQVDTERLMLRLSHVDKMEAIGRLAGGLAHDFNNLLTVISSSVALIRREPGRAADDDELLAATAAAADRAAKLTRQLLAFTRQQRLEPRIFDVRDVVQGTTALLRPLLPPTATLTLDEAPEPALVRADPVQLERVLLNLVTNAADSLGPDGAIGISVSVRGDGDAARVRLEVYDTGRGIDAEARKHLFEPFFTTKAPGLGTGLGLSTAYGIVKQCGGDIEVESEVGVGSTFRVLLPRATGMPEAPTANAPRLLTGHGTILLVEDEALVRDVARLTLERAGYVVVTAENGEEALQALARHGHEVRLLVSDVIMPKMNGRELMSRVRERQSGLPVLLMSGHEDQLPEPEPAAGAHFLRKPFTPERLLEAVAAALVT